MGGSQEGIVGSILRGRGVPLAPSARYGLAAAIFAAALAARFLLLPPEEGLAFLTFYPAVGLAALVCGTGPGMLTVALGAVLGPWLFMAPYYSVDKFEYHHLLPAAVFILSGTIICFLTHQMRRAGDAAMESNRRLTRAKEALELREAELARANERLRELDQVKTEFFANVSHEFRTPLTLMLAPLEDLLASPPSPEVFAGVDLAHRNALRLLKLVNGLLDFSRLEAGRVHANVEATDLAAFTAELASNFRSACEQAWLILEVDCPPLPAPVLVDRDMWEKVVLNLVSNAFKFTFTGRIAVRLRAVGEAVELTVEDTGTGIPADELPHVFERFHRVKGSRGRSFEGSGIGLALVHEFVHLLGGEVRVASRVGVGSQFVVSLPLARAAAPVVAGRAESSLARAFVEEARRWLPDAAPAVADAAAPAAQGRVVVADDNADLRAYIRRLLEEAGFTVETAADGEAALAACRARPPDLVLADVMMPRRDGFALLRELRAGEATAGVPVILLSARAGEQARIDGLDAGADDYLVKPFHSRELVARIEGALRLARVRREAQRQIAELTAALTRQP